MTRHYSRCVVFVITNVLTLCWMLAHQIRVVYDDINLYMRILMVVGVINSKHERIMCREKNK